MEINGVGTALCPVFNWVIDEVSKSPSLVNSVAGAVEFESLFDGLQRP